MTIKSRKLKVVLWAALLFSVWGHVVSLSLPFHFQKAIRFKIVDRKTNAPIPGAIAEVAISKTSFFAIHGGTSHIKKYWVMSNAEGVVAIRPYFFLLIFSKFNAMTFYVQHPWYGSKQKAFFNRTDFAAIRSGGDVIFMDSMKDRYATSTCYSEGTDPNGKLEETCENGGQQFRSEIMRLRHYYEVVDSGKIKRLDPKCLPSKAATKEIWNYVGRAIYKGSPYKPWRTDPGNELIK